MSRSGISNALGIGLLVVGVVIGVGLVFGAPYATGSLSPGTMTQTNTKTVATTETFSTTYSVPATSTVTTTSTSITTSIITIMSSVLGLGALVSITSVSCTPVVNPVCTFTLTNTGNASATIQGARISYGQVVNTAYISTITGSGGAGANVIPAGGTASGTIAFTIAGTPEVGAQFAGTISLGNGEMAQFIGTFLT